MSGRATATSPNVDDQRNENGDDATGRNLPTTSGKDNSNERATSSSSSSSLGESRTHSAKSWHCLLLQDTTRNSAPVHLQMLFNHSELQILSSAEILFQLIYLVALETGFAEHSTYQKCVSELHVAYSVVTFFDLRNVLLLVQHKPTYNSNEEGTKFRMNLDSIVSETTTNANNENLHFVLSGIVTGDFMIATLTPMRGKAPADTCSARSICLTMPRYVLRTVWKDKTKSLQQFLAKMDEMSYMLRENLFVPIQNEYLAMTNAELYPALLGLPGELYDSLFHCLSPNQLRILANVNKQLNQLVINSKHYSRAAALPARPSFLSPSQSRGSSRFGWESLF